MVAWRHDESLAICEQALALARRVGAREAEVRALTVLGSDLAYLGRGEEGLAHLRQALRLAEESGDRDRPAASVRPAHRRADDAGTATRVGAAGGGGARGHAPVRDRQHRARREPDRGAARDRRLGRGRQAQRRRAPRASPRTSPTCSLIIRADLEIGRGDFDAARAHLEAARRHAARGPRAGDLRRLPRRAGALGAPLDGRRRGRPRRTGAGALPRRPRRSASGSAPRDCARRRSWQRSPAPAATPTPSATGSVSARKLHRRSLAAPPPRPRRSRRTPPAGCALAEAEYERARGVARPELWSEAAAAWERLERPPLAAYCRWRQAEALVAAGASRTEASVPLRQAHAVAARIGAQPLLRELELLAQRARLDLARRRRTGRHATARSGGDPRPDATRGRGPDPRRPRLHQPRDRRDARHQRQDGQRPRLAHPAQARRAEQARGGRHRAPRRPAKWRNLLTRAPHNPHRDRTAQRLCSSSHVVRERPAGHSAPAHGAISRMRNHAIGTVKAVLLGPSPDAP